MFIGICFSVCDTKGNISDESLNLLNSRVMSERDVVKNSNNSIVPTKLRALKKDVANENEVELLNLENKGGVIYKSEDKGEFDRLKDVSAVAELKLKIGAQGLKEQKEILISHSSLTKSDPYQNTGVSILGEWK